MFKSAGARRSWRGNLRYAVYREYGRRHGRYAGLQCVTYARSASGIDIRGNAASWWGNAEGSYARGNVPEPGSVLSFRAIGPMRYGHVAVVSAVVNARTIEIDHANWAWARGSVARGVSVVDVSPNNDWTAVRVGLGHTGDFGSIYPTNGFIYPRPAGDGVAGPIATGSAAPVPLLNPPPRDFRASTARPSGSSFSAMSAVDEVAAPQRLRGIDLRVGDGWDDHTSYEAKW
jgi:surface antigen